MLKMTQVTFKNEFTSLRNARVEANDEFYCFCLIFISSL